MPRRTPDPTLVVLHKRIEALTKRVEKLDREVFKAIRIDAENCMPEMMEELQQQQQEIAEVVRAMVAQPYQELRYDVNKLQEQAGAEPAA